MRVGLKRCALLHSAASALCLAGTLQAGLVSTVNGSGDFLDSSQTFGCSNTGTTTASCSFMRGDAFQNANGSYQANAQYGSLDVTSMSSSFGAADAFGTSTASFTDTFLLTGGIGAGTLVFVTEYRGFAVSESCGGNPLCVGDATVTLNTFMVHPVMGSPTVTNLSFSFTFGSVFNLNGSASAHSSALFHETAMTNAHLRIDAIEVLDSNGALITDYAVTTGSGANYAFVTPEPGTLTLVVGSLVALLVIRRKSIDAHRRDDARGGSKAVPVDYDPRTENGARAESSTGALGEASEGRAEER